MRELEEVKSALEAFQQGVLTDKQRQVLIRAGHLHLDPDFGFGLKINSTSLGKAIGKRPSAVEKWLKNRAAAATGERGILFFTHWMTPPGENGTVSHYEVTTRDFKAQKNRRKR